jgi:hypothetical protein
MMGEQGKTVRLFLDRIEGHWAVFELEDGSTFEFPGWLLPADSREGQSFMLHIERDPATDAERQAKTAELRRQLRKER